MFGIHDWEYKMFDIDAWEYRPMGKADGKAIEQQGPTPVATPESDPVNPSHYGSGVYSTANVLDAWDLNWRLANVVKYISRAGKKGDALEDLKKALWYLQREIRNREQAI